MESAQYEQYILPALRDGIGKHGLDEAFFESLYDDALKLWQNDIRPQNLGIFSVLHDSNDLQELLPLVTHLQKNVTSVIILGTGGSSLGGQTLYEALRNDNTNTPKLYFVDNIDPVMIHRLMQHLDPTKTGLLAISKSGETAETLAQFNLFWRWMDGENKAERTIIITEPTPSSLRELSAHYHLPHVLEHRNDIGGRYSVFSNVGLLPAMIAGINVAAIRQGAAAMIDTLDKETKGPESDQLKHRNHFALQGVALNIGLAQYHDLHIAIQMIYADRMHAFGKWWRQLWAESLGKKNQGTTPMVARGTVDQHSQLQLWLDGPRDKFFTIVTTEPTPFKLRMDFDSHAPERLKYMQNRSLRDLFMAEQNAIVETLKSHQRPTRQIHLKSLDAHTLGALLMQLMLETVITAKMLRVDPFDQPAVEHGKKLTREYMENLPEKEPIPLPNKI